MTQEIRPDLTSYAAVLDALVERLNEDSVFKFAQTDVCKMALERAYRKMYPDRPLPAGLKRKMYIPLNL